MSDKIENTIFECYKKVLLSNFWLDNRNSVKKHSSPKSKKTKFSEKMKQLILIASESFKWNVLISYAFQEHPFRTPLKYAYMIRASTLSFTFLNNCHLLYMSGADTEVLCDSATELGLTVSFLSDIWFLWYSNKCVTC